MSCRSNNQQIIAFANSDNDIIVYDVQNNKELHKLVGHKSNICKIVFSADDLKVASVDVDNNIIIWSLEIVTRKIIISNVHKREFYVEMHSKQAETICSVQEVIFSPDGKTMATCGLDDTKIKIWSTINGQCVATMDMKKKIYSLGYSFDGQSLFAGSWTGRIYMWQVGSGMKIQSVKMHDKEIIAIHFLSSTDKIVSVDTTGNTKTWDLSVFNKDTTSIKIMIDYEPVSKIHFSKDGTIFVGTDPYCGKIKIQNLMNNDLHKISFALPMIVRNAIFVPV